MRIHRSNSLFHTFLPALAVCAIVAWPLTGALAQEEPAAAATAEKPAEEPDDAVVPAEKTMLFNGEDLEGWKLFLPNPEADATKTWSVTNGVIACTGKPAGYLRTEKAYKDYILHVEWRWAEKPGNSGVLLHMSPPDKVWPKSIEAQLRHRDAGDFYVIGGTEFKEHDGKMGRRVMKRRQSSEKELGEWNTMEVGCQEKTIAVFVNGTLQNNATEATVNSGHICLQSEGAPIEFRNVYLTPVK